MLRKIGKKNKRALSEIVSYVLLISISFALAGMVYTWLKFYVNTGDEVVCDGNTALSIRDLHYNCSTNSLNLSIQNSGMFSVDGYVLFVNNKTDSEIGVYKVNSSLMKVLPQQTVKDYYSPMKLFGTGEEIIGPLTYVEVQSFVSNKGTYVYCKHISRQKISC